MKVTKYAQSCLLVEKDDQQILIDPGSLLGPAFNVSQFGEVGAVFYTHIHDDHYDARLVQQLQERGATLYGNQDVVDKAGGEVKLVRHGQELDVVGFRILPYDLPHCRMTDGAAGPPNTGFLIDNHFFHPGDGTEIKGLTAEHLAAPIAGPSIGFDEAAKLVRDMQARKVIPIHYDYFKNDPDRFAGYFVSGVEVVVLAPGESVEV